MKSRAAVAFGPGKPLEIVEIDVAPPRKGEVLVRVQPGDSVAVFGLGGIGLAAIQGARQAKAGRIIAIDTNPAKFELARTFGATECLNPKDFEKPIHEVLIEMTGWGVDRRRLDQGQGRDARVVRSPGRDATATHGMDI